jgi:glycosyltransferase involved in cell wall biosynthesis
MAGHATAFIHGRPEPHPTHAKYARSVRADFVPVDFLLRWHDRPAPRWRRYLSSLLCSAFFPGRRRYSVFLAEGPQFVPVIMKRLRLLGPRQKIIALLANETLFFLKEGRYSASTARLLIGALRTYDALICIGEMEAQLARLILGSGCPRIYTTFNGPPAERQRLLSRLRPALTSHEILFIGHGPDDWRAWYKGIDLMLEAFRISWQRDRRLRLTVAGNWSSNVARALRSGAGFTDESIVRFTGPSADLAAHLSRAALYLHCGRGDAWAISVLEAMCAGVVPIVSEWTGAGEVVRGVSEELICPLDAHRIADRILWYFGLLPAQREELSARCRAVVSRYTEAQAIQRFVSTFRTALEDLGLSPDPARSGPDTLAGAAVHTPIR